MRVRWGALGFVLVAACAAKAPPPRPAPAVEAAAPPPVVREKPDDEMVVEGTLGQLSDDEISGPFQRRWSDISRCYATEKQKLRYLGGKIELKFRAFRRGFRLREVPIVFIERETGESKMSKRIVREAVWRVWWLRLQDLAGRL